MEYVRVRVKRGRANSFMRKYGAMGYYWDIFSNGEILSRCYTRKDMAYTLRYFVNASRELGYSIATAK